ncbi:hypothetical protein DVH24_003192 [Malus domestica]|uniref:Uncharacterized protein n=1 Tax=Malus domestica TaxID=3750 RepID=A0A498IKM4_MALDO|nr:hypothetical protein DVH24_003192 [Malus domestica]
MKVNILRILLTSQNDVVNSMKEAASKKLLNVNQGYGTFFMEEVERITSRQHRSKKIAVIRE